MDWIEMMHYQQQLQKVIRLLLPQKHECLTSSEWELLAWLYLKPDQNSPIVLSHSSGMKKEAVSRCLKSLYEKGYITKEKHLGDERSYRLFITDTGLRELKNGYEAILTPFYDLMKDTGSDFIHFLKSADQIANTIEDKKGKLHHEIL